MTSADLAASFRTGYDAWRGWPVRSHLLAVLALTLVAAVRWWACAFHLEPMWDERVYLEAFAKVARGESPFAAAGYLYPPGLALAGAALVRALGEGSVLVLLRLANLAGVATIAWCALAWAGWGLRGRFLAAAAYLALAPAVGYSLCSGNVSNAVVAVTLIALMSWPRRPATAGVALGAGIAIKPIAPLAAVALLFHKPIGGGRAHLVAGSGALAVAALLSAPLPWFRDMFSVDVDIWLDRTVSLYRLVVMPGWAISPLAFLATIAILTIVLVRLRPLGPIHLLIVGTTAAIAASPMVRPHTLLLLLPLQFLAIEVALRRRRSLPARGSARFEPVLVFLGVAAIQLAEGATALDFMGPAAQLGALLPVVTAPFALAAYLLKTTETF